VRIQTHYRRRSGWILVILFLSIGAALILGQHLYLRHHLPLVEEGVAAASAAGAAIIESIGTPDGATAVTPGEKRTGAPGPRNKWHGTVTTVTWVRLWDAPGSHEDIEAWYAARLPAAGWRPFLRGQPTSLEKKYWRDQWLLTIAREAAFPNDRPPHARFHIRLEWGYFHNLGPD
jgi:hypothetical protein